MAGRERQRVARVALGVGRVAERELDRREIEPRAGVTRDLRASPPRTLRARRRDRRSRAARCRGRAARPDVRRDRERAFERGERGRRVAARELDAAEVAQQLDRIGRDLERRDRSVARALSARPSWSSAIARRRSASTSCGALAQERRGRGFGVGAAPRGEQAGDRFERRLAGDRSFRHASRDGARAPAGASFHFYIRAVSSGRNLQELRENHA